MSSRRRRNLPNLTNADLTITANIEQLTSIPNPDVSFMVGAGVVLIMGYLEGQYTEERWQELKTTSRTWNLNREFRNMYRIRNAFAHSAIGVLTPAKARTLNRYLTDYKANPPLHMQEQTPLPSYYEIEDDRIILDTFAVRRCRSLCLQFKSQFPP